MALRKGDRVISTEALGGIVFSTVPKGTEGVIVKETGFLSSTYEVHFDNGRTEHVREAQIAKINRRGW